jgi:glycosyltransferase involved in cell wall biosynthesis
MRVLQLVSCRGWSSDAYWAASISAELESAGHDVTLVCKRGSERRVIERARAAGVSRVKTLRFASGLSPVADAADVRQLVSWLAGADVVHVHRGKEHWLAAVANRLGRAARPIVRTRHIVQPIRAHALNRWLYRSATALVITVTDAIRSQCVAAELMAPDRVLALPGGVDLAKFHPGVDGGAARRALGAPPDTPLIGIVSGLRVMKGHAIAIDAAERLARDSRKFRLLFVGEGAHEPEVRRRVAASTAAERVTLAGFVPDPPAAMAALDVALYPALESDGMSRVLFEYLAVGKPVVASRVGVVPEILEDGATALLVPGGDAEALALAIARLLDDRRLGQVIGLAGARLAESRFSGARVAAELARRYASLAGLGAA